MLLIILGLFLLGLVFWGGLAPMTAVYAFLGTVGVLVGVVVVLVLGVVAVAVVAAAKS